MSDLKYDFPITLIPFPLETITGVWEFTRPPYFKYLCYSLPDHLLHLVIKGSYTVRINNRKYDVKTGDIIYYYESEEVESVGNETEVTFYSVGFQASKMSPLPINKRVFQSNIKLKELFHKLFEGFSSDNNKIRKYKTFAALLDILDEFEVLNVVAQNNIDDKEELWWALERRIRKHKKFRPSMDNLCEVAGFSKATVIRSCKKVTGDTPLKRIQKIRMEEAKGLLRFANLNVSQVSEYLGYPRLHEFSREFSKFYGEPPSSLLVKYPLL